MSQVRLAVTLGDPRGIGPEVVASAARRFLAEDSAVELTLLGADASLPDDLPSRVRTLGVGPYRGTLGSAGACSLASIEQSVAVLEEGDADALVTGPVHKPALHAAGATVPGQTELLAERTGSADVGMLMHASSSELSPHPLRILLATTHLPLAEVPAALTRERLDRQLRLLDRSLRRGWGIERPRIGLCGLNPHASDGGLFGTEEGRIMVPLVGALRDDGLDVRGPFPADTVFLGAVRGELDAIAAPYHDVGMAVFKTVSFGRGVNTTLGLPFPRTSPDHGTAFDLAGTGRADSSSTLEALRLAAFLARRTRGSPAKPPL